MSEHLSLLPARLAMALRARLRPPVAIRSRRERFAFIPIPKCGSSAVKQALLRHFAVRPPRGTHPHARSLPHTAGLEATLADPSVFKFTFVRNPWHRLYSTWWDKVHARKSDGWLRPLAGLPASLSFPEFVCWVRATAPESLDEHVRPQSLFVVRANRCLAEFVGHVEHLERDWHTLQRRLGLPALGHRNDRTRPQVPDWDPAVVQMIGDYYADDVERFGYSGP